MVHFRGMRSIISTPACCNTLGWAAVMALSRESRASLLNIARAALLERVTGEARSPSPIAVTEPDLNAPAGCFVSLHEHTTHRLGGCVGRIDPQASLAETVRKTAGDVLEDPRFVKHRVTSADLR